MVDFLSSRSGVQVPVSTDDPLPVSATVSASIATTAHAAAPTFIEGSSTNPLSSDLSGNLRVKDAALIAALGSPFQAGGSIGNTTFASTIADGADVTEGAKADAAATNTDTTPLTAMSVRKQISKSIQAAAAALGISTGAAVVTDADGTVQQYGRGIVKFWAAWATLWGALTDAAWDRGTGAAPSVLSLCRGSGTGIDAIRSREAPISTIASLTPNDSTVITPGKYLRILCTVAGNVKFNVASGTTIFPVNVGLTLLPVGVTKLYATLTTATATYENWS